MDHIISENPKPVCKNRISIIDYNTARFRCPSGLGACAIINFFILNRLLTCWRSHPELRSGPPSICRWYAALLHCQHKALSCWYQCHWNLHARCAGIVSQQELLLNPAKSEVIAVGTPAQWRFATKDFKMNVASSLLHLVDKDKSHGVYIDSDLSMDAQDNAVCGSCKYKFRAFKQIHPDLPAELC